jgi:hypothetical protein
VETRALIAPDAASLRACRRRVAICLSPPVCALFL